MTALAQATLSRSPAGRVIAIMVNFNGKHFLDASIGSALAALEDHHGDLLLVDNASCDGSADYVRERFPRVALLVMAENTGGSGGFSAGMCVALACPQCEFVWLLDNDIRIEGGALGPLLTLLDQVPRCGAVGSQICLYDQPEIIQEVGGHITPWLGALRQFGSGAQRLSGDTGAVAADYLAACSVLIRRDCLEEVGPFKDFFVYYDDVDWGLRACAAGWQLLAEPASVVCHAFTGLKPLDPLREYYRKRNRALFLAFHPTKNLRLVALWIYLCYLNHLIFWYGRLLDNRLGSTYQQALLDIVAGRFGRSRLGVPGSELDFALLVRPPNEFLIWLHHPGESKAAAELLHALWPNALVRFAVVGDDTDPGVETQKGKLQHWLRGIFSHPWLIPGSSRREYFGRPIASRNGISGQGSMVIVVDDRFPLLALSPGSITLQYLAGEVRLMRKPVLTWVLLRVGRIIAAGYGLIMGTLQFPGVVRGTRASP